jgi:hypothetical protein
MQVSIAAVVKRSVPVPRRRRPHHRSAPTVARVTATSVATPRAADDTAPILVPDGAGIWTFGDHLRHLAGHAGTIPLALDEYGRCLICLRRGFFRPNA